MESRLDKNRFIRVHRSHIINIDRVIGHRRNGDSEMVELTASDHYSVPVSRSRIGWLKSRINRGLAEPITSAILTQLVPLFVQSLLPLVQPHLAS